MIAYPLKQKKLKSRGAPLKNLTSLIGYVQGNITIPWLHVMLLRKNCEPVDLKLFGVSTHSVTVLPGAISGLYEHSLGNI